MGRSSYTEMVEGLQAIKAAVKVRDMVGGLPREWLCS